jgi:nucleoside-diphosphate-sugar epimerase
VSSAAEATRSKAAKDVIGPSSERSAIVTGATGLIGRCLLPLLLERSFAIQAISRRPRPPSGSREPRAVRWVVMDLERPVAVDPAECLIHTAPLWLLPELLRTTASAGVKRLVAVSSTSLFTKREAGTPKEREMARRLAEAERIMETLCREHGIRWTVLRPTLIYGGGRDRNVSDIARFIARFGFFPIAGAGAGRRQPVHAADLAAACLAVLDNSATFERAYETPGGETLTYVEMVSRIARGVGRPPRLIHLPRPLLRVALAVASRLPGRRHMTADMADRMDQDLAFDDAAARRDFGYDPRPFRFPDEPSDPGLSGDEKWLHPPTA